MKAASAISVNRNAITMLVATLIVALAASLMVSASVEAKTIKGTNKANKLVGTSAADTINGFGGNDKVYGKAGNDKLNGGRENDKVFGELGNDRINGDLGNDFIAGANGNDFLQGGPGADNIIGASGNDRIYTGFDDQADKVSCGAGSDVAYVQTNDFINGLRVSSITVGVDDLIDDCEVLVIDGIPLPVGAIADIPTGLLQDIVLGNDLSLLQLLQLQGIINDNSELLEGLGLLDLVEALLEDLLG